MFEIDMQIIDTHLSSLVLSLPTHPIRTAHFLFSRLRAITFGLCRSPFILQNSANWLDGHLTLPETNSKLAPKNGWLEYDPASYWGPGQFSGAFAVSFGEGIIHG